MATFTTNKNLYKWNKGDVKGLTLIEMANNATKIDFELGKIDTALNDKATNERVGLTETSIEETQADVTTHVTGKINEAETHGMRVTAGVFEYFDGTTWKAFTGGGGTPGAVPDASTTVKGIVMLNDTVTSTSVTLAATANAVKTAMDRADSAFLSASNGKTDIVSVTGSPATSGDTFTQLKTHIQNAKNTGATNLVAKGVTDAVGTMSLATLFTKISEIPAGTPGIASGSTTLGTINNFAEIDVDITGITVNPTHFFVNIAGVSYINGVQRGAGLPDNGLTTMSFTKLSTSSMRVRVRNNGGGAISGYVMKWWASV